MYESSEINDDSINFALKLIEGDQNSIKYLLKQSLEQKKYDESFACLQSSLNIITYSENDLKEFLNLIERFENENERFTLMTVLVECGLDIKLISLENRIHIKTWIGTTCFAVMI